MRVQLSNQGKVEMEYRVSVQLRSQSKPFDAYNRFELRTEDFETDEAFLDAVREQLAEILSDERDAEESEL